jgi:diguanylate cyclase (GGDEF)-like protein
MADANADFLARLQALRDSYAEQLPGKIDEIKTLWQRCATQADPEGMKTLHRLVHSLTGSGATFGYAKLSESSRLLESCLKEAMEKSRSPDAHCRQRIEEYLQMIEAVASPEVDMRRELDQVAQRGLPGESESRVIYLVDDDALQAQDLSLQLKHFGYEVRVFSDTQTMREAFLRQQPAAVVMDIMFPEGQLAGTDAIAGLKEACSVPPPVVFVSSRGDLQTRLAAVRACGDGYFTKPVDISALIDTLDRLTEQKLTESYRILLVDDDAALAEHYAATLRQAGMEVVVVNHPLDVMRPLAEFKPELILMDLYMPECDGLELAAVLRQQPDYLSIPIVFLTTEIDSDLRMKAMHLGADDFLNKPIPAQDLVSAVASRAQRSRVLRSYMIHDSLTGLYNHSTTKDYLEKEFSRVTRKGGRLAFAMIDLDQFKVINDTHGHACGDRVLKSLAHMLRQRLRRSDIVGRIGGEEFAVILHDVDAMTAVRVMDGIRADFSVIRHRSDQGEFSATFSCGIAMSANHMNPAVLYESADKSLYKAKHAGRNRVVLS